MALSTTTNRITYAGNDSTTPFSFPYYFLADGDLVVIITVDATGVETVQTITTHYTVTGAGVSAGGTVTMVTAPATGETLTIYRDAALTQGLDLVENDAAPAESIEEAHDRAMMISQRLEERIARSVELSDGFTDTFTLTLPSDLATANATIVVNAAADGFDMGPTTTEIADAEAEATAAAASAAAALVSENNASTSETNAAASAAAAAATLASSLYKDVIFYTSGDSPVTLTSTDNGILHSFDTSGGAISVTLPEISGVTLPFNLAFLLDTAGNDLTINRGGASDTIQGATSKVLSTANIGFHLVADTGPTPDIWSVLDFGNVEDGAVTTAKLDTDSVTTVKITDANVTRAKLATGAVAPLNDTAKTTTYTVTTSDDVIMADSSGGAFTFTMPTEASASGRTFTFKKTTSDSNAITINNDAAGEITTIDTDGETVKIFTDGTSWFVLDRYIPADSQAYTPTITGAGTVTAVDFYWHRVGKHMIIVGKFTTGTPTGVELQITLPNSKTISSDIGSLQVVGHIAHQNSANQFYIQATAADAYLTVGLQNGAANPFIEATGGNFVTGAATGISATIPITGWKE